MDETETLHDEDFYSWAEQQAALLRAGRLDLIDVDDLAEEIETLGRSEAAALRSSDRLIAMHLLKMIHRPAMATASRENTVDRERLNVETCLADNPGLKPRRDELFRDAYALARRDAAFETKLDIGLFPPAPPFERSEAGSPGFWPPGFPLKT